MAILTNSLIIFSAQLNLVWSEPFSQQQIRIHIMRESEGRYHFIGTIDQTLLVLNVVAIKLTISAVEKCSVFPRHVNTCQDYIN